MVKKILVKYSISVNGEWYFKERYFDKFQDAFEFMSSLDSVYKFTVQLFRNK